MFLQLLVTFASLLAAVSAKTFAVDGPSPFYSFTTNYAAHPYGVNPAYSGAYAPAPLNYGYASGPVAYDAPAPGPVHAPAPAAHAAPAPAPGPAPAAGPVYHAPPPVAAPVIHSSQYHAQDEFGSVEYGYSNINSAKKESRDHYGNVAGAYSYVDATGLPKTVSYVADAHGFRVTAANNLPLAPLDTPEVAAARHAHLDAVHAAAAYSGH